jgi:hypothetical protein
VACDDPCHAGDGNIRINRNAQVGDTITFNSLSGGVYYRGNPVLRGTYVIGNIPPLNGSDFNSANTNVVQNSSDSGYVTGLLGVGMVGLCCYAPRSRTTS